MVDQAIEELVPLVGSRRPARRWGGPAAATTAGTASARRRPRPEGVAAPASTVFHYPSGHVAVATALALSLVLILWPTMTRPRGHERGSRRLWGLCAALLDRRSVRRGLIQLHAPDQAADRAEDKEGPSDSGRL